MNYTLKLNAKFQPFQRRYYEDLMREFLVEGNLGKIIGASTMLEDNGEVLYCHIKVALNDEIPNAVEIFIKKLEEIGIPKGSKIYNKDFHRRIGNLEGMGIYINNKDLSYRVYRDYDIDIVGDMISDNLGDTLMFTSYMERYEEIGLYFYVKSCFSTAHEKVKEFIRTHPLCERCRIEQIA